MSKLKRYFGLFLFVSVFVLSACEDTTMDELASQDQINNTSPTNGDNGGGDTPP